MSIDQIVTLLSSQLLKTSLKHACVVELSLTSLVLPDKERSVAFVPTVESGSRISLGIDFAPDGALGGTARVSLLPSIPGHLCDDDVDEPRSAGRLAVMRAAD